MLLNIKAFVVRIVEQTIRNASCKAHRNEDKQQNNI